jgi:hypothetical protein
MGIHFPINELRGFVLCTHPRRRKLAMFSDDNKASKVGLCWQSLCVATVTNSFAHVGRSCNAHVQQVVNMCAKFPAFKIYVHLVL